MNEERRILLRKQKAKGVNLDTSGDEQAKRYKSGEVKHARSKEMQIFQAKQLLKIGSRYTIKNYNIYPNLFKVKQL